MIPESDQAHHFEGDPLPPGDPVSLDAGDDAGDGEPGRQHQEHAAHVLHPQLGRLLLLRLLKQTNLDDLVGKV